MTISALSMYSLIKPFPVNETVSPLYVGFSFTINLPIGTGYANSFPIRIHAFTIVPFNVLS